MDDDERPHYLRFARAVALVSITAAVATAGCAQVRERIGCQHCHCPGVTASLSQPFSCDLVGPDYCCTIIEGPLPPPDLAT